MQPNRSLVLACCATLLAACGGGSSGPDASFTMYGSAHASAVAGSASLVGDVSLGGSPTSLKQVFYKAWVSASQDCSDPILVQDHGDAGKEIDYFANPVLFAASPPDGTYPCVIVRISDTMQFTPDAEAETNYPDVCLSGHAYTFDVFRDGSSLTALDAGADTVGQGTHSAPVAQKIDLFFSTDTSAVAADEGQLIPLDRPLVVPGQTTFFMDMSDKVNASSDGNSDPMVCWLDSPDAGFR